MVLSQLAGIAAWLAGALPARGGDVPFTERVISTAADFPGSVFATDVDGDGDTDVLSASFNDNKIAWYENGLIDNCPPVAADLDNDCDVDLDGFALFQAAFSGP